MVSSESYTQRTVTEWRENWNKAKTKPGFSHWEKFHWMGALQHSKLYIHLKKNTNKYQSIPPIEKYNIWNNDSKESIPNAGNNAEKKIMLGNQENYESNKSAVHKSGATYWSNWFSRCALSKFATVHFHPDPP